MSKKPSPGKTTRNAPTAEEAAPALTTYYNGACPVCRTEIEHYKRIENRMGTRGGDGAPLGWVNLDENPEALAAEGLTPDDVLRRMYVRTADGELKVGVDAFIEIWDRIPGYRWLSRLTRLPGLYHAADRVYDQVLAAGIYRWNKRRMARLGEEEQTGGNSGNGRDTA